MKFLVVEDTPEHAETISVCIEMRWPGSSVLITEFGAVTPELVEKETPDLVLLDLKLPDADGIEVLKRVRMFSTVPIIVVSGADDQTTIVKSLESGADDFIKKPYSYTELLARINTVLRRAGTTTTSLLSRETVQSGDLIIDLTTMEVLKREVPISLTKLEWSLLSYLARNANRIVTHEMLARNVWGYEEMAEAAIKAVMYRLRRKLGTDSSNQAYFQTHRGIGYSFVRLK